MPQPIEAMKRKRPRNQKLRRNLRSNRPSRKRSSHARALKVPAYRRCDEICEAEDVEAAAEDRARDSVQG